MVTNKFSLNPENWVQDQGDYLYNFAYSRVLSATLAEDLVQETFLAAYTARENFKGNSSERTWLTAILKNKIIDHFRKADTRKQKYSLDADLPFKRDGILKDHWEKERAPQTWKIDETVSLDNPEFVSVLQRCLSNLPEKWAIVFSQKVVEDRKTDDICKDLNISASNLWVILHRCRLKLRECLEIKWFKNE